MSDLYRVSNEEILCVDKFIGDESCAELCELLSQKESTCSGDKKVKRLVLRGNCLSTRSAQSLGVMLRGNHNLDLLSLEWNQLGSSGAAFISHAMETNTHLEQVDLRNNGIGDEGAAAFGESLLSNASLRVLDLRWNQIGDEGAASFEKVFQHRKGQLSILLTGNLVSHKMMQLVEKWSQAYKSQAVEPVEEEEPAPCPAVDTFEARYKELLKEHKHLKHQQTTLLTQNADMRRQLDASAINVTELEQQLLREEFRSGQLEEELRGARKKISEMTNEYLVASAAWETQRLEAEEGYRSNLADMTTEIKGHVGEKESLKERLRKAKESFEHLEVHSERLQRQAREEAVELRADLNSATEKASEAALQEAQATTEARMAAAAQTRAMDQVSALEAEVGAVREQMAQRLAAEGRAHQEETEGLRRRMAEGSLEAAEKIGQLSDDLGQLRSQLAEAESQVSSLKIQMQQSCDDAASTAQKEERERCDQIIENLKLRIENLSTEKHDADGKLLSLGEELKGVRQEHNAELRGLQSSLAERRGECESLRQESLGLGARSAQLEAEAHQSAAEVDRLRTRVADIDGREARLQGELHRVTGERDALLGSVQTLEKEGREEARRRAEDFLGLEGRLKTLVARELDSARPNFAEKKVKS